jgi:hypothetical protein
MTSFEEFLDKISPLKTANKLGAILFQLSLLLVISRILNNFSIDYPLLIAMNMLLNSDILLEALRTMGNAKTLQYFSCDDRHPSG